MKRKEFIKILASRINFTNEEEKNSILSYYDELILEKIEDGEHEEEVIKNLGSIEYIVRSLNGNVTTAPRKIIYEEEMQDTYDSERKNKQENEKEKEQKTKETVKRNNHCSIGGIIGHSIEIFVFAILTIIFVSLACSFIGLFFNGLINIILILPKANSDIISFSFDAGIGAIQIGLGLILSPVFIKLGIVFIKKIFKSIKKFFRSIFGKEVTV